MIIIPPVGFRYRQEIGAGPCPVCGRALMFAGLFLCSRCLELVPHSFRNEAGFWAREIDRPGLLAQVERFEDARRHYRTATLACVVAARLRLAE